MFFLSFRPQNVQASVRLVIMSALASAASKKKKEKKFANFKLLSATPPLTNSLVS